MWNVRFGKHICALCVLNTKDMKLSENILIICNSVVRYVQYISNTTEKDILYRVEDLKEYKFLVRLKFIRVWHVSIYFSLLTFRL